MLWQWMGGAKDVTPLVECLQTYTKTGDSSLVLQKLGLLVHT